MNKPEEGKVYRLFGKPGEASVRTHGWSDEATVDPDEKPEPPRYMPAYCDPDNINTGSKHEATKDLDIAEIAKLVRKELRAAYPAELGRVKFAVRISRYSMGQSIDVSVKEVPAGFEIVRADRAYAEHIDTPVREWPRELYTEQAQSILDTAEEILRSYNRTNIDSMADYYEVRFSWHVRFDWKLETADKEAALLRWIG